MEVDPDIHEELVAAFENEWERAIPQIDAYLPHAAEKSYLGTLLELVIVDMEFRWKRFSSSEAQGNADISVTRQVEAYVEQFPILDSPPLVKMLVKEEFTIRRKYGDRPSLETFHSRFPHLIELFKELDAQHPVNQASPARRKLEIQQQPPMIEQHTILQEIGEGGMGTVYLAQQESPVRRQVAVKVVRRGLDSKDVLARFEAERQALAMMDHPSIAGIYEAGVTDQAQPYFSMEYVAGVPITEYCTKQKLSLAKRLKLLRDVCSAVQHAHQKGVLHRDIKPTNILVVEKDGQPLPKVIDFGLAKAIGAEASLTDKTVYTHAGQVLGTLKYMSPEQATIHNSDIDTRVDVYALGVLLYELLTGKTPLDDVLLQEHGMLKTLELIHTYEPSRPSVSLTGNLADLQTISAECGVASATLSGLLRGDLDWIVMKALDHDRDRRYASASNFADDIERFLNDEPVEARPPSFSYKLQKFTRKNRILVFAALAMLFLLVAGIATTSWQAIRATRAEIDAKAQREIALAKADESEKRRKEADSLRSQEAQARKQAELSVTRTKQILAFVINSFQSANPLNGAKKDMLARDILLQALEDVRTKIHNDPETQADLYYTLASSLYGLSDYSSALRACQLASSANPQVDNELSINITNLMAAIYIEQGDGNRAWEYYLASLDMQRGCFSDGDACELEDLLAQSPLAIETLTGLAQAHLAPPDPEPTVAVTRARQALTAAEKLLGHSDEITNETRFTLAMALRQTGDLSEALKLYDEILTARQAVLPETHPEIVTVLLEQGVVLDELGNWQQAIKVTGEAVRRANASLGKKHAITCTAECQLGDHWLDANNVDEAKVVFQSVSDRFDNKQAPVYWRAIRGLARSYLMEQDVEAAVALYADDPINTAWVYVAARKPQLAARAYEQGKLLRRAMEMQLWKKDVEEARRAIENCPLENYGLAASPEDAARICLPQAIAKVRLAILEEHFAQASAEAKRLLTPWKIADSHGLDGLPGFEPAPKMSHLVRNVDRAWLNSLLARANAEQNTLDAETEKLAIEAFEQLYIRMPQMPDYMRWTVGDACETVIRIYELQNQPEQVADWKERLAELESERVQQTLDDHWQNDLYDWKAGGLGDVPAY